MEVFLIRATETSEIIHGAAAKRISTLTSVLWTISSGLLWFVVALIVLGQIGVNSDRFSQARESSASPSVSARSIWCAIWSAAFFLLFENQIRVGDIAIINGTGGLVESVTFRTVVLRDQAGVVHVFPNGAITTLANATMDWSAYVIDVAVSYNEDPDRVIDIMRRVARRHADRIRIGRAILEPIEIFGVDNFTDTAVIIKARFKTQPAQQIRSAENIAAA